MPYDNVYNDDIAPGTGKNQNNKPEKFRRHIIQLVLGSQFGKNRRLPQSNFYWYTQCKWTRKKRDFKEKWRHRHIQNILIAFWKTKETKLEQQNCCRIITNNALKQPANLNRNTLSQMFSKEKKSCFARENEPRISHKKKIVFRLNSICWCLCIWQQRNSEALCLRFTKKTKNKKKQGKKELAKEFSVCWINYYTWSPFFVKNIHIRI